MVRLTHLLVALVLLASGTLASMCIENPSTFVWTDVDSDGQPLSKNGHRGRRRGNNNERERMSGLDETARTHTGVLVLAATEVDCGDLGTMVTRGFADGNAYATTETTFSDFIKHHRAEYSSTEDDTLLTSTSTFPITDTLPYFEATVPGPTIRMRRGHNYTLTFVNTLEPVTLSDEVNGFKDANVSNLHLHGAFVSPRGVGDNVFRVVNGGEYAVYEYHIPADHAPGTYYVHGHHHGSSYLQMSGGLNSVLVIEDEDADEIPKEVKQMDERVLVINEITPDAMGLGGDTLFQPPTTDSFKLVNGVYEGDICIPMMTWQRWRVLFSAPFAIPRNISVEGECEMVVLARDGVWRTEVPARAERVTLTGASRVDLGVRCWGPGDVFVRDDHTGYVENTHVAYIVIDEYAEPNPVPSPFLPGNVTWFSPRPAYLPDLRDIDPAQLHHSEFVMGPEMEINDVPFTPGVPQTSFKVGEVQEFKLVGVTWHPFHMHVWHMQMIDDACLDTGFEAGEYYDTIASSMGANCTVRFWATGFDGNVVYHCHILDHEDLGMINYANVTMPVN